MINFIDLLKGFVTPDMITKVAGLFGEKGSNVSSATGSIFASLMGLLSKGGNDTRIKNIFDEAGNSDILSNIGDLFDNKQSQGQQKIGTDFLQAILGDKAANFTDAIVQKSGISKVATNGLISMVAPVLAGFFGKKVKENNWSATQLQNEILSQKDSFIKDIPQGISDSFGLSSIFPKLGGGSPGSPEKPGGKKKKWGWIMWPIIIALLLLAALWWWKSCKSGASCCGKDDSIAVIGKDTTALIPIKDNALSLQIPSIATLELALPGGIKINAKPGGMEEKMLAFLNSDEYKKASDEDLKKKWFQFEDVSFKFGSSTELTDESQFFLNNIAEILKNHKDVKIKIGGYADKVGSEDANLKISQQRAETVAAELRKKGVGEQIESVEGFGDQFATHNAGESDTERAADRNVALRFVKVK